VDVPLDEFRAALPSTSLRFAPGFTLDGDAADGPVQAALRAEAQQAAVGADVVLMFLGLPAADESEGFDRKHIHLPDVQTRPVRDMATAHPNTPLVVVLCNGSVIETSS
jgi:beta-glucosidase